jgi:hypothetical protein
MLTHLYLYRFHEESIDGFSYFLLGWCQEFKGGEQVKEHKASPNPSEVCTLGVDCGAARGRLESRKQSTPTPRKNVCACVNLTEICLANVVSSTPWKSVCWCMRQPHWNLPCEPWYQVFWRLSRTQNGGAWQGATSMFCFFCENGSGIMNVAIT